MDEIFGANCEVSLSESEELTLRIPPRHFIDFLKTLQRFPFDGVPPNDAYITPVSFYLAQAHRHWIIINLIKEYVSDRSVILDIGSFPFGIPILMRRLLCSKATIHASVIQELDAVSKEVLDGMNIKTLCVDLDPHVVDETTGGLPPEISLPDESVDFVLVSHVIEHLYHPMNMLSEVRRVLRPGGIVMIITDNARMISAIHNLYSNMPFIYEPVLGTCAMTISKWRGHVRFFTAEDISTMLESAGIQADAVDYFHAFYATFDSDSFTRPILEAPRWLIDAIVSEPELRNDVVVIGKKM
jgi:SAM-dependent methyltransferase